MYVAVREVVARFHVPEILAGIVPAVGIALASDVLLALLERRLAPAFPGGEDVTFRPPHLPPRPR
ncbi:MAG: hypothetical protein QFX32_05375 [Methanolinea sp.]|nr:hypothetical protein [Methanolinea sp.]